MLSPRLYFTFLILAASQFLHGSPSMPRKQVCLQPSYTSPAHKAYVASLFSEGALQAMDADLDEDEQDTKSSLHSLVIISIDSLHGLKPCRHKALHFCKYRAAFAEPALIPFSIFYSVWRL